MALKPVIASYSGESYKKIVNTLTQDYLDAIANIASSTTGRNDINDDTYVLQEVLSVRSHLSWLVKSISFIK